MKRTILLLTVLLLGTQSFANDISASYSNSSFEEIFHVDRVTEIEMWQQPRLQYTPKNLRTQYQMRFNGRTQTGVASYTLPITDYDTYITESYFEDGKFYIKDNTGKSFQTGELQEVDTSALETAIQDNTTNINNNVESINNLNTKVDNNTTAIQNNTININKNTESINRLDTRVTNNTNAIQTNTVNIEKNRQDIQNLDGRVTNNTERLNKHETQIVKNTNDIKTNAKNIEINRRNIQTNAKNIQRVSSQVQTNTQNINALHNNVSKLNTRVDNLQSRVDRLDNRLEQGLATVSALAGLHPNPRHQGRTQVSVAAGMYADNVAGAIGVFHYLNDKVMLSAGASYGGDNSFAGNVGITIGF